MTHVSQFRRLIHLRSARVFGAAAIVFLASSAARGQESAAAPSAPPSGAISVTAPVPDERIAERLRDIFSQIPALEDVRIDVSDGVVTLTGAVGKSAAADETVDLARRTEGVVYVRNEIEETADVEARLSPAAAKLREFGRDALRLLPTLGVALAVVIIFALLARWAGRLRRPFAKLGLSDLAVQLAQRVLRTILVGIGIVIALEILDATAAVGAVLGLAGVAGIALGFAFRNIIENYLAGILLSARNPFNIGDLVEVGEQQGKVARLTSRDTVLITLQGNHLRIPNSDIITSQLVNFTRNPLRRLDFLVGVGVDFSLADIRQLGRDTLLETPGVLAEPPPFSAIESLGDSAVNVRFFAWVDQRGHDFLKVRSEAIRMVKEAFDRAGIEIPEPIYQLRIRDMTKAGLSQATGPEPASAAAKERSARSAASAPPADTSRDDVLDGQVRAELERKDEENLLS